MSRAEQLYQEVILDHNRNPRNYGTLEPHTHSSHGRNPLCGDDYFIYLKLDGDLVSEVGFQGAGCAISKASASMMTTAVKGKSREEILKLKDHFLELITSEQPSAQCQESIGRLKLFEGVRKFPVRVKCAALAWRALEDALSSAQQNSVSTE